MNTAIAIAAIAAAVIVINIITYAVRDTVLAKHRTAARYPHPDGDFTVLGPEIFTDKTGDVISWKGENYVRKTQEGQAE